MNHRELVKYLLDNEFENIKGYEDLYKINKKGEIWSCYYKKNLKPLMTSDTYYYVNLVDINNIRHKCRVHRLLGLQYIPNPENKSDIDHIDRNRQNNSLDNLRWTTHKTNCNNIATGNGCVYLDKSTTNKKGRDFWKASYSITIDGVRKAKQKGSFDKQVCIDWLEEIKSNQ